MVSMVNRGVWESKKMKQLAQHCICIFMLSLLPAIFKTSNDHEVQEKCTAVVQCTNNAEKASQSCYDFMNLLKGKCGGKRTNYCDKYKMDLVKACTAGFCKKCSGKAATAYTDCIEFYQKTIASEMELNYCEDIKNKVKCPHICQDGKGWIKENPGKSCKEILNANDSTFKSGLYWIQPDGDVSPVQSYCDMSFYGGGWTLASYGYVATTTSVGVFDDKNKNIPNMNHPNGYTWNPNKRNNSHGVISLQHGAVNLACGAKYMIMAAGNNPVSGGINQYGYIYFIDISNNPYKITFANHNRYHGGVGTSTIPKMHVVEFTVTALKGETGSEKRYALAEALGISWVDSYPTGYGFSIRNAHYVTWKKGPFFPSVHTGDGRKYGLCKRQQHYAPDVTIGCPTYAFAGWQTLYTTQKMGQTSIWFK